MLFSSKAFNTPICAIPLAAPPLKTTPTFCALAEFGERNSEKKTVTSRNICLKKVIVFCCLAKLVIILESVNNTTPLLLRRNPFEKLLEISRSFQQTGTIPRKNLSIHY